jgi:hypothetical protein
MSNIDVLTITNEVDLLAQQTMVEILPQSQVSINLTGVGYNRIDAAVTTDGSVSIPLPVTPVQLLAVYNNGLLLLESEYSIIANVVGIRGGVMVGDIISINYI